MIGRAAEVAAARQLVARPDVRLVTLTGPGGSGKTRLAIEVAAGLAEDFADGVAFVDLSAVLEGRLVATAIQHSLGLRDDASGTPLARLTRVFRGRCSLLVLDNCEQVVEAAPDLARLLEECPGLTLLATSRVPLRLTLEHELPVPPLPVPPGGTVDPEAVASAASAALFLMRAQMVRPDFQLTHANAASVARICARLDGLPLAIELAAARLRVLPPAAIEMRLDQGIDLLADDARDRPSRQRTLRNTMDWSYELLTPVDQALFRRLGVFVGGASLDAAAAVARIDRFEPADDFLGVVTSLVESNLVQRQSSDEPRVAMLETIREYAAERLAECGEVDAARRAHALFFMGLAEQAADRWRGPEHSVWLDRLESEQDNFRAALRWAIASGEAEVGLRTAIGLWMYWTYRGSRSEASAMLADLLALPGVVAEDVRSRALSEAGAMANLLGDPAGAIEMENRGLALARQIGDRAAELRALHMLVGATRNMGDFVGEANLLGTLLATAREAGDVWYCGYVHLRLSEQAMIRGDSATAAMLADEALQAFRTRREDWGTARVLCVLGACAVAKGDFRTAAAHYAEAEDTFGRAGDRAGAADAQAFQAGALTLIGELERARALYARCLPKLDEIGNFELAAHTLDGTAMLAMASSRPAVAIRLAGAADALRTRERLGSRCPQDLFAAGRDRALDLARRALGSRARAISAEGRAMTLRQAIAHALAPEHGPDGDRTEAARASLTTRERSVAALVARGLTNRQISEELVVAQSTTARHIANILSKLGFHTRAQIAAWYTERST